MNPDTDKADEVLRSEIAKLERELGRVVQSPREYAASAEYKLCRNIALLQTTQKDREALKVAKAWLATGSTSAHRKVSETLASQTETIIRILS